MVRKKRKDKEKKKENQTKLSDWHWICK